MGINFLLFISLTNLVQDTEGITETQRQLYSAGVGALNGTIIFIFSELYNLICMKVVDWENHMYSSEMENSYLSKTFVFNFCVSYINLFYYAFLKPESDEENQSRLTVLGTNFVSLVLVKNLTVMGKMHILPFLLYQYKKIMFNRQWTQVRTTKKRIFVS